MFCQYALKQVTGALLSHWEKACTTESAKHPQREHVYSFRICLQIVCQSLWSLSGSGWESVTCIIILSCRWINSGHLPLQFCARQWNLLQARLLRPTSQTNALGKPINHFWMWRTAAFGLDFSLSKKKWYMKTSKRGLLRSFTILTHIRPYTYSLISWIYTSLFICLISLKLWSIILYQ